MSEVQQTAVRSFRGRIGPDPSSGFYAAPHRYELYVSLSCPGCLRIAITHSLLVLEDRIPLTLLPAAPDGTGGYAVLRAAYEAAWHRYPGPAAVPVLSDRWTGRIVSNYTPHILRDLATRFRSSGPELYPRAADKEIEAMAVLCEEDISAAAQQAGRATLESRSGADALRTLLAALDTLEKRLAVQPFLLGDALTAADVHLWVTLVHLDTVHRWHLDAEAVHRIATHPHLWAYARRLLDETAFRTHLRLDDIARGHHHACRGQEAAGAAVQIIDWTATDPVQPVPTAAEHCG